MSVVVGLECEGGVWMASDSCVVAGDSRDIVAGASKICDYRGFGLGVVGDWAHVEAMQAYLSPPARGNVCVRDWLMLSLIPAMKAAMAESGVWEGTKESRRAVSALIAVEGCVYSINDDWTPFRSRYGYGAIGSGSSYALGAMSVTGRVAGERRVAAAVRAAARHCTDVSEPIDSMWVP